MDVEEILGISKEEFSEKHEKILNTYDENHPQMYSDDFMSRLEEGAMRMEHTPEIKAAFLAR
jgi:hypothetical protein